MPDLTKLVLHSAYPAFKNNNVYEGSFNISGTVNEGTNSRTHTVNLGAVPDILDVVLRGRADSLDDRPSNGWFKEGRVSVPSTGVSDEIFWMSSRISGSNLIITANNVKTTSGSETLTSTPVDFRIVDYSVAGGVGDNLNFDSRLNYLKRSQFVGNTTITVPSSGNGNTHTINYTLGYIPFFSVGAQLNGSTVWSNNYRHIRTGSTTGGTFPEELRYWCTTNNLTIQIFNGGDGNQGASRTVYWAIYLDYGQ